MRAADQAHSSSAATYQPATTLLNRLLVALVATLALLMVWRPTVVRAQEAKPSAAPAAAAAKPTAQPAVETSRAHVVRAGETLWSLAARYYGDGHAWQRLARTNNIATDGKKAPLEIGMTLRVPVSKKVSGSKAAAVAAAPADSTVPKVALAKAGEGTLPTPPADTRSAAKPESKAPASKAPAGSLSAQTAGKGNAEPAPARSGGARPAAGKAPRETAKPASASAAATAAVSTGTSVDSDKVDLQRRKQTVMTRDGAVRIGLVTSEDQSASRKATEVLTVFHRDLPDAAEAERRTSAVLRPNAPTPRQGEFDAAPYVVSEAQVIAAGVITGRVGAPDDALGPYPQRALRTDAVELKAAPKSAFTVGQLLQAFATTRSTTKGKLVVVPSGMLEVKSVGANGTAIAVVREQSGRVEQGQHVFVASGTAAPRVVLETLSAPDVPTTITWIDPTQSLPSLQSFVLLGAGSAKGVKAGDEFGLYHQPRTGSESLTAKVRVVRVEGDHSAAVIVRQFGPEIGTGMTARRVGRAP